MATEFSLLLERILYKLASNKIDNNIMCCAKNINFSLESSVLSQSRLRIGGGGVPIHMVRKQNAQEIVRGTSNCRLRILQAKRGFFKGTSGL